MEPVIVNLSSQSLNRYLRVRVALQVSQEDELVVAHLVEQNRVALRDWLITHLAGKTVDDLRGTEGINHLRKEVDEQFGQILSSDGDTMLQRVVFDEFNPQ